MRTIEILRSCARCLCAGRIIAGVGRAGIGVGTLRDPQGAPVPGAVVRLTESSGEFRVETVSNSQGRYAFYSLEPGACVITASLQGFKTTTVIVTVSTGQPLVADLRLDLGQVSESIRVRADTPGQLGGAQPDARHARRPAAHAGRA